jgi:hypothetical protein
MAAGAVALKIWTIQLWGLFMTQQIPPRIPVQTLGHATPQAGSPVRIVGLAQRRIMWVILAAIVLTISFAASGGIAAAVAGSGAAVFFVVIALISIMRLAILVLMMIGVFKLAAALGKGTGACVVYTIAMIIPLINLILLLTLNQKATTLLKSAGIRVGLMGPALADLPAQ